MPISALDSYLEDRKEYAESVGFRVIESPVLFKNTVSGKLRGYVNDSKKEIFLATKAEDYYSTAIHEYCHLDQYLCNDKTSRNFENSVEVQNFDLWVKGRKTFSVNELKKSIKYTRDVELDCEKRTVQQIIKYDLCIYNISRIRIKTISTLRQGGMENNAKVLFDL
jgi:hypothetical protein